MRYDTFSFQKNHLKSASQAFVKAEMIRTVLKVKSKILMQTEVTVAFRKILSVTAGVL